MRERRHPVRPAKTAGPVTGGRASWDGKAADAGASVQTAGDNNFQGRYIIRHYWQGKVACAKPEYDRWGGPPGTPGGGAEGYHAPAKLAQGLALAVRGRMSLKTAVRSPVPTLGLPGQPPPRR